MSVEVSFKTCILKLTSKDMSYKTEVSYIKTSKIFYHYFLSFLFFYFRVPSARQKVSKCYHFLRVQCCILKTVIMICKILLSSEDCSIMQNGVFSNIWQYYDYMLPSEDSRIMQNSVILFKIAVLLYVKYCYLLQITVWLLSSEDSSIIWYAK